MNLFNKTFHNREFVSILGKGKRNFWILFAVFFFSIGALEVSRSGLKYLAFQMSDPFINWVEIKLIGDNKNFEESAALVQDNFSISTIENNNYLLEYLFSKDEKKIRVEGRTIAYNSQLLERILDSENAIVVRPTPINQNDYGWVVTESLMERLGYTTETGYPMYVDLAIYCDTNEADRLGIHRYGAYVSAPIPLLAVVKQLPDLFDFMAPTLFEAQNISDELPFNISLHEDYFTNVTFVSDANLDIESIVREAFEKNDLQYDNNIIVTDDFSALRPSKVCKVFLSDTSRNMTNKAADLICHSNCDITRIYEYEFGDERDVKTDYISFMFDDLSKVAEFSKWAKDFGVRIDMAQIEAKNHFNIFNGLTAIMCLAIVILSILFVSIFVWFLIDSHFRSISKNLGTFMAFGLSNKAIVKIYLQAFMRMLLTSLILAISLLAILEYLCVFIGWMRPNQFRYFSIEDIWVWIMILLVILLSVIVICFTIRKKLNVTPGDLIFDRNNKN